MLGNWIQETTNTSGTGTMDLAGAVTGFVAASSVYADGQEVEYFIEDGNNREHGVGVFTLSGTTLTRALILETLDTVNGYKALYKGDTPTAISLSGSAAKVYVGASAYKIGKGGESLGPPTETTSYRSLESVNYFSSLGAGVTVSLANRMMLVSGYLSMANKVTTLGYGVGTADAACTHFRLGIYEMDKEGEPGLVLYDSGDLSASVASTGHKTHTVSGGPIILPAGFYALAIVSDSTSLGIYGFSNTVYGSPNFGLNYINNWRPYCHGVTGVTGALPNNPTTAFAQSSMPCFGWR